MLTPKLFTSNNSSKPIKKTKPNQNPIYEKLLQDSSNAKKMNIQIQSSDKYSKTLSAILFIAEKNCIMVIYP